MYIGGFSKNRSSESMPPTLPKPIINPPSPPLLPRQLVYDTNITHLSFH